MPSSIIKTYTMIAADADGVCLSQTPAASGVQELVIGGALHSDGTVTLTTAQRASVTGGAETSRTFTFTGTDLHGDALVEAIVGPNSNTVYTVGNFLTITSVTVDDDTAGAITVGIDDSTEFDWIPLDKYQSPFEYAYQVEIETATFQIESTLNNVQDPTVTPTVFATVEASGSSDVSGNSTVPCIAIRVKVAAFTTGDIVFKVLQPG